MRTVLTTTFVLLLTLTARGGEPDLKAFQGSWKVQEATDSGKSIPKDVLNTYVMVFKGDEVEIQVKGMTISKGTFKLDPAQKPKAIDMARGKDNSIGIYAFDGAQLKICLVPHKKDKEGKTLPRPTAFDSTRANLQELIVLERLK